MVHKLRVKRRADFQGLKNKQNLPGPLRNNVPVNSFGMVPLIRLLSIALGLLPSVVLKLVFL